MENLKFVGVLERQFNESVVAVLRSVLARFGVGVEVGKAETLAKKTNFFVSIGGDGSYISLCRDVSVFENSHVFGIHAGRLGFLTDVEVGGVEAFFAEFFRGEFFCERLNLLSANFDEGREFVAVNDVAIVRQNGNSLANVEAFLGGKHFNTYRGDGILVSSATGSTAYNLSAGGAIIHPNVRAFSLTPLCSHSLTQRPLVLPAGLEVEFRSEDDVSVVLDGQESLPLYVSGSVKVGISERFGVNLVRPKGRDYFAVLKSKLRWGSDDK